MATDDKAPLPKSIRDALPAAGEVMQHVAAIEKLFPVLTKQMAAAEKAGAVELARAFVVLHRLREVVLSDEKSRLKPLGALFREYSETRCPAAFEQAGITSAPLSEGLRVGVSYAFRASIKKDMKDPAYAWLRANKLPDIITTTVNASSLSAALKCLRDEHNVEAPEKLFNAADVPYTSVTKSA